MFRQNTLLAAKGTSQKLPFGKSLLVGMLPHSGLKWLQIQLSDGNWPDRGGQNVRGSYILGCTSGRADGGWSLVSLIVGSMLVTITWVDKPP